MLLIWDFDDSLTPYQGARRHDSAVHDRDRAHQVEPWRQTVEYRQPSDNTQIMYVEGNLCTTLFSGSCSSCTPSVPHLPSCLNTEGDSYLFLQCQVLVMGCLFDGNWQKAQERSTTAVVQANICAYLQEVPSTDIRPLFSYLEL